MPLGFTNRRQNQNFPVNFSVGGSGTVPPSGGGTVNFLRADSSWAIPPGTSTSANPSAQVGLSAVNGSATTFMTSDSAPALSQAIVPTWTGQHTHTSPGPQVTLGAIGTVTGSLNLVGLSSGAITVQPQAAAGTYNFNLPTTAGTSGQYLTSQAGGSSAMTWTSVGFFQSYTPTLSAQAGTLGTTTINSARYVQIGNLINLYLDISITSAGTSPTGYFQFTLPVTPAASVVAGSCAGLESNATTAIGGDILGTGGGSIGHIVATGSSPNIMLNGNRIILFGMYEA